MVPGVVSQTVTRLVPGLFLELVPGVVSGLIPQMFLEVDTGVVPMGSLGWCPERGVPGMVMG